MGQTHALPQDRRAQLLQGETIILTIEGKHGVKATILKDSLARNGSRFISYELEYPRIILAELNTHRADSKSSASSRAIPFAKMVQQLTGRPIRFGEANKGMQDKGEDFDGLVDIGPALGFAHAFPVTPEQAWELAKNSAMLYSKGFADAGFHKQVYNRLTEAFQMMKTIFSGTELENFFWLRHHEAADPSLAELARVMYEAREQSMPQVLNPGEWHLPYVENVRVNGGMRYFITEEAEDGTSYPVWLDVETARKVSAARSAAVSFRNVDYGVAKCEEVFQRLVGDDRKHASAFEHQGTPMQARQSGNEDDNEPTINEPMFPRSWEPGVSHMDRDGNFWSGNLKGFVQFRKLIPGENYTG